MSQTIVADHRPASPPREPGIIGRTLSTVTGLLVAVLVAVALSIAIEWAGIVFKWWPVYHSLELLLRERGYIEAIERFPLTVLTPVQFAESAGFYIDGVSRQLGVERGAGSYAIAAINTIKLVALRLAVCVFTIPAFVIVSMVAVFDGLVARDIRKYTGGHESSYVFHAAKRFVMPSLMLTVSIYLMLPFSIPPVVVFGPTLLMTGVMLFVATSRFKKYL